MARALKPAQMKQAMASFLQMDLWTQRKIGRQAGLKMFDQLIQDMPTFADDLRAAKKWEKQAITACDRQDQAQWDEAVGQVKSIFADIKQRQRQEAA